MKKYRIELLKSEVDQLMKIISKGSHTAHAFLVAYVLLNCDEGKHTEKSTNEHISKILKIGMRTIDRIKKRFIEEGLEEALKRKPSNRVYERKIDGEVEAKLVQLCCSEPPKGYAKWSLRLLADKMVELQYIDEISHVAVGEVLKKMNLSPGK